MCDDVDAYLRMVVVCFGKSYSITPGLVSMIAEAHICIPKL